MKSLKTVSDLYEEYMRSCADQDTDRMVMLSSRIGTTLEEITCLENQIHVYSFETPREQHAEASRLIARLRNPATSHEEFLYYIQRAYELLFVHVYADKAMTTKRSIIQMTPVGDPCQNYAVHRIPDIDSLIHDSVMCVMLRGVRHAARSAPSLHDHEQGDPGLFLRRIHNPVRAIQDKKGRKLHRGPDALRPGPGQVVLPHGGP